MNGVEIIGAVLRRHAALIAAVPLSNIKPDKLPETIGLPNILVHSVSVVDRQSLAREAMVRSTERVSVTARARTGEELTAILKLVRTATSGVIEMKIGEAERISILTAGVGPTISSANVPFERTQQLSVTFDAPA